MTDRSQKLLSSARLGALDVPNRVVMAPMTRNRAEGTVPGALNALYYTQRATAGLMITEGAQIAPMGQGYPETPGLYSDAQIQGWRGVNDAVHAAGGRLFAQLWHVGRVSHPSFHDGALPVAPSAIAPEGEVFTYSGPQPFVEPRALETDEIPGIIDQFRRAAERAKEAGFDGVEVHGANGYLLDQFLQSGSNRRNDRWGGSVENRARLLLEVTRAVADVWGADRVGVRLSPGGTFNTMHDDDPAETWGYAARALSELGLAYVHVIHAPAPLQDADGNGTDAVALVRAAYDGTLIAAGNYTRDSAERALRAREADFIAFGRPYIANPDLVSRFAFGAPLNEPDPSTFYGGGVEGFTDQPILEAVEEEAVAV